MANKYNWNYCSLGGVVRVNITSGEDIAHLGELDQKLWTVLSCPVKGLQIDPATLALMDTDGDGKIRVPEVVAAAQWLTSVVKDKDSILKGEGEIALGQINTENEAGAALHASAKQILANLGKEKDAIAIEDTADSVAIFAKTQFNGDGIITPASADDEALKALIATIAEKAGSVTDRSGEAGIGADQVEAFYTALADYSAWQAAAKADEAAIFPYGADTEAALQAAEALKDKIADYFMRCKLISFDEDAAGAVDVSVEKIGAISDKNLATQAEEIAAYPLARPSKEQILPFEGINPAWQAAFASLKALILDKDFEGKGGITEAEWNATLAKFGAYTAWKGARKGDAVESLGIEEVDKLIAADQKAAVLALIEQDKALEAEAASIDAVNKLTHLYRDFAKLLRNYVIFSDFYGRSESSPAVFEAGRLFIDQRCCNLCINVEDMGKHADMAALSGMFLIYCACTSKTKAATMNIAAVMTAGSVRGLRPGKNGVFYDLDGNDWDAVITKVVDNPISVRQAFWSPYRKLSNFISDKITKSAADKENAATSKLLSSAETAGADKAAAVKQPFDIAKYAGIFAAVGLAVGALGAALAGIVAVLKGLAWWQFLLIIAAIMIVISGPSCFIAWRKLRKRDLGPVLNANGWAINSSVLVNILFGGTLTSVAKYPRLKLDDPYAKKTPGWLKAIYTVVAIAALAFGALFFTGQLQRYGMPSPRQKKEAAAKAAADSAARADSIAAAALADSLAAVAAAEPAEEVAGE